MLQLRTLALAVATLALAGVAVAAAPRPARRVVSATAAAASPAAAVANPGKLVLLDFSDVMFMTDKDGKNFWQVRIDNKGSVTATNVVVPAWLFGFMPRSEQPCHAAPVASLAPGATAYARGPLPLFEGAHLLRLRSQVTGLAVELPRPYRRDGNDHPEKALKLVEFNTFRGPRGLHFQAKTNVNVYGRIPGGTLEAYSYCRFRKRGDPLFDPTSYVSTYSETPAVPTGGRLVLNRVIKPQDTAPSQFFDHVGLRLNDSAMTQQVDESFYPGCGHRGFSEQNMIKKMFEYP